MFKVIVLMALFAVVYGLPAPDPHPAGKAPVKVITSELGFLNENDDLEGAATGWGWGGHKSHVHYYPVYYSHGHHGHSHGHGHYGHGNHYSSHHGGWW